MTISRYRNDTVIRNGSTLQTNASIKRVREAIGRGLIVYNERPMQDGERLDTIAYEIFGDGGLWWVIAAMSNIGWWLQVPPGTMIRTPVDVQQISRFL